MAATCATEEIWTTSIGKARWRALVASWLGWMFDGYEAWALVLVMGLAVRQFLPSEKPPMASIYTGGLLSVTLLGWAVGGIAAGVLADYIGRKRMLMLSILWYAVFAGLTALSRDYWSLLIFRFFTGIGLGAEWDLAQRSWPSCGHPRRGGALRVHSTPLTGSGSSWHPASGSC
jgi:MFS family permease